MQIRTNRLFWLALIGFMLGLTRQSGAELDPSHAFRANPASSVAEASNPENAFEVRVDGRGVELVLGGEAQRIRLSTSRLARGAGVLPLDRGAMRTAGTRAELHRLDGAVVEWYVNDARGLEQGFTLRDRPLGDGAEPLELQIALAGQGVLARPDSDGGGLVFTDLSGAVKLRFGSLFAIDASGRSLPAEMRVGAQGLTYRVDDRGARYPIVVDPLASLPNFTFTTAFAASAATAGDLNCDGKSDLAVGAPTFSSAPAQVNEGGVWVYLGGAGGIDPTPDWVGEGNQAQASFGAAVASAGDVNGDGCDDLLVGAPLFSNGQDFEGAAFLFLGIQDPAAFASQGTRSPGNADWAAESNQPAPPTQATNGAKMGSSLGAGDFNGDGFDDLAIGANGFRNASEQVEGRAFVWLGSSGFAGEPDGTPANADFTARGDAQAGVEVSFGFVVASAGDVNDDGWDDLLVGAPGYTNGQSGEGIACLWLGYYNFETRDDILPGDNASPGRPATSDWFFEGSTANARLGFSLGTAGDVNGDGFADVVIGAPGDVTTVAGRAYVFTGVASPFLSLAPSWSVVGGATDYTGVSVSTAGDVNGDGRGDVAVGSPSFSNGSVNEGALDVYTFAATAPPLSSTLYARREGDVTNGTLGAFVASVGDVNDDGFGDVLAGSSSFGTVRVYLGSGDLPRQVAFPASSAAFSSQGNQAGAGAGFAVSMAGDIDLDGYDDYIVGAPFWDGPDSEEGTIQILYGGSCGPACGPVRIVFPGQFEGNQAGARLGSATSGAGDVNGDGFSDVIVGAPNYDVLISPFQPLVPDAGIAVVYLGSTDGLTNTLGGLVGSIVPQAQFGYAVAGRGDVNGDGFGDVVVGAPFDQSPNPGGGPNISDGRAYLYLGSATGISTSPVWIKGSGQDGSHFGIAVSISGDVNRDGYSDLVVGADAFGPLNQGAAFVYLGNAGGLAATPVRTYLGPASGSSFGQAVAIAGDLDMDGFSDIAVGAPTWQTSQGMVRVFRGAPNAPSTTPIDRQGELTNIRFGQSVSTGGDVDGDGFGELYVGANWFDGGALFATGKTYLFRGQVGGISASPDWTARECGAATFCDYGVRVSGGGDVNGDGFGDLLSGAFKFTNGQLDEGAAFLHLGNGGGGSRRTVRQDRVDAQIALLGRAADGVDTFSLGGTAHNPAGGDYERMEMEVRSLSTPLTGILTNVTSQGAQTPPPGGTSFQGIAGSYPLSHWQVRFRGRSPFFPHSPWVSMPGNGKNELDLREVRDPDADGITSTADNCPSIANANQLDGDVDVVGDLCDNCTAAPNSRVPDDFLTANPWATLTGGQRDDDHDGFGNVCDGDFPGTTAGNVGPADTAQYKASLSKDRATDTCGTLGTRPCAIFDLNLTHNTDGTANIGPADTARFKTLLGLPPGPKCAACTGTGSPDLPCAAGATGTCF